MAFKVTETRWGKQIYSDNDAYFAPLLERCGEYVQGEVALWEQLLKPGMTCVDAGANIGCHSMALAKIVGPGGGVIAFEPQMPMFYSLLGTAALNEFWQVHAYPYALGATRGKVRMPILNLSMPNSLGGCSIVADSSQTDIPKENMFETVVLPLDDLQLDALHFFKIDVEGWETEVLAGAKKTIEKFRPILYVENDRAERSELLIGTMKDLDYSLFLHIPPLFNFDNWKGCQINLFPGVVSVMLLGIPKESVVTFEGDSLKPITCDADMPYIGTHKYHENKIV